MKKQQKQRKRARRSPISQSQQPYPPDWVPIQVPPNLDEMFLKWIESDEPSIGICLQCGDFIRTEADLIPGTPLHNCTEGRALEEESRKAEPKAQADQKSTPRRRRRS